MKNITMKYLITIIALSLVLIHLIWPSISIDAITLFLLAVSILPWLNSIFKSIELPGGLKVEYQELEKIEERAVQAGLITTESNNHEDEYSFQTVASKDPNLALAGLRIELEKRLINLGMSKKLPIYKKSLFALLEDLNRHQIINAAEKSVMSDLIPLLNSAVHGAKVDISVLDWALDIGPKILKALDKRSESDEIQYSGIT